MIWFGSVPLAALLRPRQSSAERATQVPRCGGEYCCFADFTAGEFRGDERRPERKRFWPTAGAADGCSYRQYTRSDVLRRFAGVF